LVGLAASLLSSDGISAALDEWTDAFMKRIEEIRTAQNCKAG
jgi:hypothetical protein